MPSISAPIYPTTPKGLAQKIVSEFRDCPNQSGTRDRVVLDSIPVDYALSVGWGVQLETQSGERTLRDSEVDEDAVTSLIIELIDLPH